MREGWNCLTIKDLCLVDWGNTNLTKKSYIEKGEFLAVSAAGGDGRINHKEHAKFTPVLSAIGAQCGRMFYPQEDFTAIKNTITLTPKRDKVQNKFLYYLLTYVTLPQRGAGQPFISKGDIEKFSVFIPESLEEQKEIVSILDDAFASIDKAKANIEKNIENAKELEKNWTFEQIINSNWNKVDWGEICDFIRGPFGGSLKKSMFIESGYAVYEQKQAIHNDYDALRYFITNEKFQEMKRFEVKNGDLIMSCSGVTLGRVSKIPKNHPKGIINQALLKLTPKTNRILADFLVILIRSQFFQNLIFKFSGGAAQPNVPGVKILKSIKMPCPSIERQKKFIYDYNGMKGSTEKFISSNNAKLQSLEELKKSILQKAFSGELTNKSVAA